MKSKNVIFLLLLILISIICGLPHLFGYYYQGKEYSLFSDKASLNTYEETFFYLTRTKQILNGDLIPHDAHIYEYQKSVNPYISETLPSYVMAFFALIFGSPEKGFIAADFIIPPMIFLLTYYFVKSITKNKYLSVVSSLSVIFAKEIFIYFPYPIAMIKYIFFPQAFVDMLPITRSFHPEVSIFFYFLALVFIYKVIFLSSRKNIIFAGLMIGLNFYNYIFYWTTVVFGLSIFFLINIKDETTRKKIITITVIGFLLAIPYFHSLWQFSVSPFAGDFFAKSTSFRAEFPLRRAIRFIIFSVLIFILLIKQKKSKYIFLNSFIFAAALLPDISFLVMKKDLESSHWIKMAVWPTASLLYPILIWEYLKKCTKSSFAFYFKKTAYFIVSVALIYYAFQNQLLEGMRHSKFQRFLNVDKELFQEINKIPKKSVVAMMFRADQVFGNINLFIPVFSDNFVYVPYPTMTVASTDEIINRNLVMLSLFRTNSQIVNEDVRSILINSHHWLNYDYFSKDQKKQKKQILDKLDKISVYCKKYKMDYIVLEKRQVIKTNCFKTKKIFHNEKYSLYEII